MASVLRLAVGALSSAMRQATSLTSTSISTSTSRLLPAASAPQLCARITTPAHSTPQRSITTTTCRSHITASGIGSSSSSSSSSSLLSSSSSSSRSLLQRPVGWALGTTQGSIRSYHVRVALKKRCSGCYFVRRKGRLYVECKTKPRHKQMQVMSKRKTWKEDYSKGFIQRAVFWKYDRDHRYYKLGDTEFARHDWLKGKIGVTV